MPRTQHTGLSRVDFLVDAGSASRNAGRQIAWDEVPNTARTTPGFGVVVGAAGAIATATTVPVDALPAALPSGTRLFATDGTVIVLTAAAAAGATSLTVTAITNAVVDNDVLSYDGGGDKILKHGQPVQPAAGDAGKVIPAVSGSGFAFGLLEGPALENDVAAALTGYGVIVGGVVYRTLVPNLDSTIEAELKANGQGFRFETYADNRGS